MRSPVFDGHDLGLVGICGDPQVTVFDADSKYEESPAMRGSYLLSRRWAKTQVAFSIWVEGGADERRDKLSTLASWLDVSEPCKLVLPDTPDRYYLAVPSGSLSLKRYFGAEQGQLTFTLTDPAAFGATKSVTLASSGLLYVVVGGTCPTKPIITAAAAKRSAYNNAWGISLDGEDLLKVSLPSSTAVNLEIDCNDRICTVDGAISLVTLDSDWFELTPGKHAFVNNYGTGASTITWTERWY